MFPREFKLIWPEGFWYLFKVITRYILIGKIAPTLLVCSMIWTKLNLNYIFSSLLSRCLKRTWPFFKTKVNFFNPKVWCVKFGWNRPNGAREEFENVKMFRQTVRQVDAEHKVNIEAFSPGELKTFNHHFKVELSRWNNTW